MGKKNKERIREIMRRHKFNKIIQILAPTPHSPLPTPYICSLLIALCSLFLLSCQTTPKASDPIQNETNSIPLDAGAFAYIIADVQNAMPILNKTSLLKMKTKQLQQMLDKTTSAVIAMYRVPSEKQYRLVSWGNYPVSKAKMALGFSKDWKKQRSNTSGATYWYSEKEGLSVALDKRNAWVLSTTGKTPAEPFAATGGDFSGLPFPEGFYDFSRGAILSCWLNEPGPLINLKLREMGLPIEIPAELIFVSVHKTGEDQYGANLRIQVSSASQARALMVVLSLAQAFSSLSQSDEYGGSPTGSSPVAGNAANNGSLELLQAVFFANPPIQDGRNLNIKTAVLSSSGVSLLFDLFSLQ
jgi:hypothetical protein